MKNKLSVSNLLGIKYVSLEDIYSIFDAAETFKEVINRKIKKVPSLRDITIANLFFENSTRTKISFELAQKRLSADVVNFSSSGSSIKKGETLADTVNNILSMKVDMIVIRHPSPGASVFLSKNVKSCIINAGDGCHEHPTQALLDAFTLKSKLKDFSNKNILIVGDILHSRVALSNILVFKKRGANVKVCGPLSLIPKYIKALGVEYEPSLENGLKWCHVASMLRIQNERMNQSYFPTTREYAKQFGLNLNKLSQCDKDIIITHPGPINRGVELSTDLIDSGRTVILDQVENGVAVRMAVLYLLASKL